MTYEEIFNKVKEAYENADASNVEGHIAIEFDVCGEGAGAFYAEIKEGKLKLHKSSSNTEITNGNPCYSLEGAVYGVYQNGKEVTRLTIGADGNSSEVTLKVGYYQVKEISAPKNGSYALDTKTYNVTIGSANVTL